MTTNQTIDGVPRELIEKAMLACFEAGHGITHDRLRALLDAPAGIDWKAAHDTVLAHHRETFAEHIAEIEELKAAQPWGGAVAQAIWVYPSALGDPDKMVDMEVTGTLRKQSESQIPYLPGSIYLTTFGKPVQIHLQEQPTQPQGEPVAVKLPARDESLGTAENDMYAGGWRHGWNAYEHVVRQLGPLYAEQPAPDNALKAFANDMITAAFEGGSFEGGDIQDIAVKHGLLRIEQRTEECGDVCACRSEGDGFPAECYRKTALLRGEQPAPVAVTGFDHGSPGGDLCCEVEGVVQPDGKLRIDKITHFESDGSYWQAYNNVSKTWSDCTQEEAQQFKRRGFFIRRIDLEAQP